MEMLELADLPAEQRDYLLGVSSELAAQAQQQKGTLLAACAIDHLRRLLPQARRVLFQGPQEPGGSATIELVLDVAGLVLYSGDEYSAWADPANVEDELTVPADFLSGALENGVVFPVGAHGLLALELR